MDPATVGAALLAIADDVGGQLGNQLLTAVHALVRQPASSEASEPASPDPNPRTGLAELTAFEERPSPATASALAVALTVRAKADAVFCRALERWWRHVVEFSTLTGPVHNVVAGGRQDALLQGRDFSGVTFNPAKNTTRKEAQLKGTNDYLQHESEIRHRNAISGGNVNGAVLQGQNIDVTFQVPASVHAVVTQLPYRPAGFSGRDDELAMIRQLLDPSGPPGPVVVWAVSGLAGVGKTALAVQAAHEARERGWFGGGVLFIDLHGYDDRPVEPAEALEALLYALGVTSDSMPTDVESRASLYRSMLARIELPVLIVADNASSEWQVNLLIPGVESHKVIITSRHILGGLNARLLDVRVLNEAESIELLDKSLQAARPTDDRIARNSQDALRLAKMCAGLPLALQIVAAVLKGDPDRDISELADDLGAEHKRLARLQYDDGNRTRASSVTAAFELSYRRLDEVSAAVFCVLSLSPGPDLSTDAAASLADLPVDQVRAILRSLARAHLVEPGPGAPDRWRLHDLLRLYAAQVARQLMDADLRAKARDRLLSFYLTMAESADKRLRAPESVGAVSGFRNHQDALAWLTHERPNLAAALRVASASGQDWVTVRLSAALAEYFAWPWRFDDLLATLTALVTAARESGDYRGEGIAVGNLGLALRDMGRLDDAIVTLFDAATIFHETGDHHGEGAAMTNLGLALHDSGRHDDAVIAYGVAIKIFQRTSDPRAEGMTLNNLGALLRELGQFEEAIVALHDAANIFTSTGDLYRQGLVLDNIGLTLGAMCRFEEAATAHRTAASIFHETGERHNEKVALANFDVAQSRQREGFG